MDSSLAPSLWRTCRVLANRNRLELLDWLIARGGATVTDAADRFAWPVPSASQHLRLLQGRGLLTARRRGRQVRYEPRPDPAVAHAARLLALLRCQIGSSGERDRVFRALTALTHPRRIRLLHVLSGAPATVAELHRRCRISKPALFRHLRKLTARGFVASSRGRYRPAPSPAALVLGLRRLAMAATDDPPGPESAITL